VPGFLRRRRLPAASRPPLGRDERVVAWAGAPDDAMVIATNLGLWLPAAGFVGWHEIHKATWGGRSLTVVPASAVASHEGYVEMRDREPVSVTLLDPDHVPEQVHTRVTRSVAYTSHHALSGGGGVRVVARRVPGRDGLRWTVRYDPGSTAAQAEVTELVARAQVAISSGESVGPPG